MSYLVRAPDRQETPCDEEGATILLADNPTASISRQGTHRWIPGTAFMEFGDLAFDDSSLYLPDTPQDAMAGGILITTETFPPFAIASRVGIVAAEHVARVGAWSELLIGLADAHGGRSATAEKELAAARESVLADLRRKTYLLGGRAIIGLQLNYHSVEGKGTMMFLVTGYGTAVTFDNSENSLM